VSPILFLLHFFVIVNVFLFVVDDFDVNFKVLFMVYITRVSNFR
jgi:hypothetical protein